jgi:hypothetical protein
VKNGSTDDFTVELKKEINNSKGVFIGQLMMVHLKGFDERNRSKILFFLRKREFFYHKMASPMKWNK